VSYFVLCVSSPCLVGLAAEINKSNQIKSEEGPWHSAPPPYASDQGCLLRKANEAGSPLSEMP